MTVSLSVLLHSFVVTLLSVSIQDYIVRRLQLERDEIEENERLIRQYREDTEKMRNQIEQLKTRYLLMTTYSSVDPNLWFPESKSGLFRL